MNRDAVKKQMKALKAKAKAARKEGKTGNAKAFSAGSARLGRKLKATAAHAKKVAKDEAAAAPAAAPQA
jgi:hypothetical protein